MRWSLETLDKSIGTIFPQYITLKEEGIYCDRIVWMTKCAEQYFISQAFDEDRRDLKLMSAYHVVKDALIELRLKGTLTYGEQSHPLV